MSQELLSLLDVVSQQAAWEATVDTNFDTIMAFIKTFAMSIATQGDTGTASAIEIQLEDANGTLVSEQVAIAVRVSNDGALINSTNATIAAGGSTTLVEWITTNKYGIFLSDAAGLVEIDLTDATVETVTVNIGPAPVNPTFGNYHNSLDVTHAAP
jgi:hypothetical protein